MAKVIMIRCLPIKKDFTSIGIAYDWQKTEESINFSNYDQKLHYIVTKTKIYS